MHPKFSARLGAGSGPVPGDDQNPDRWLEAAEKTLNEVLAKTRNSNLAKNVILFLGDGMGISTITAGNNQFD
jgi:alkaline phosphatase